VQDLKYANIKLHPPFSNFFILKLITASPQGFSATAAFEKKKKSNYRNDNLRVRAATEMNPDLVGFVQNSYLGRCWVIAHQERLQFMIFTFFTG